MKLRKYTRLLAGALTAAMLLSACAKTAGEKETTSDSKETTAAETSAQTSAGENGTGEAGAYPMTIAHGFGETVIEEKPVNIVTVSWNNQDAALALGIAPAGVSAANFGAVSEAGLLPWTAEAFEKLGVSNPTVFDDTDGLDFEAISAAAPDVILAPYSGVTEEDYKLLSQIAPTIPYKKTTWAADWREQVSTIADVLGMHGEGQKLIEDTEALIADKVGAYPELAGKSAALFNFNVSDLSSFYVYTQIDPRQGYLEDMGFGFPGSVTPLIEDPASFMVKLSAENADLIQDVDIIVSYGDAETLAAIQADPRLSAIPAIQNGSVVMLDSASALAAACNPSALSIPATIDEYLGLLAEAAAKVK